MPQPTYRTHTGAAELAGQALFEGVSHKGDRIPIFNRDLEREHKFIRWRPFHEYQTLLGPRYTARTTCCCPGIQMLDIGSGFGTAALQFAHLCPGTKATVVNADDLLRAILNWEDNGLGKLPNPQKILFGTLLGLKQSIEHLVHIDEDGRPIFAENWEAKAISDLVRIIQPMIASGVFQYKVGFAENVLPSLQPGFDVISDVHGAYYYSGARIQLLEEYYRLLAPAGEGFVVLSSIDKHLRDGSWVDDCHGPRSLVGEKRLEHFLVESFPTVFSLERGGDSARTTEVLRLVRNPKVAALDLQKYLKLESMAYNDVGGSFQAELPVVKYSVLPQ